MKWPFFGAGLISGAAFMIGLAWALGDGHNLPPRPHIIAYEDDHIAITLDDNDVSFIAKTSAAPERIKMDIERAFIVSEYLRKRLKMMNKES